MRRKDNASPREIDIRKRKKKSIMHPRRRFIKEEKKIIHKR